MVNFFCSYILRMEGHFIIIGVGILPIFFLVKYIYTTRMEYILLMPIEKIKTEDDALFRCYSILDMVRNFRKDPEVELKLVGLISNHFRTCKSITCPLNNSEELYDSSQGLYVGKVEHPRLHDNTVFLKHFCKMYFDEAVMALGNGSRMRISYAVFVLYAFQHYHADLEELNAANKAKPSLIDFIAITRSKYDSA